MMDLAGSCAFMCHCRVHELAAASEFLPVSLYVCASSEVSCCSIQQEARAPDERGLQKSECADWDSNVSAGWDSLMQPHKPSIALMRG